MSRSTIYYWVRDMPIPGSGSGGTWPEIARRRGNLAMQAKYCRLREDAYEEGLRSFDVFAAEGPEFRDFVCLYIAEGYKRNRNRVSVCNSDPAVIKLSDRWMRRLAIRPPFYSIQYHADQDLDGLRAFWGSELHIHGDRIRLQRKSNGNGLTGRTWRSRYGVLAVTADDTLFRARLQAWMDCVRRSWR